MMAAARDTAIVFLVFAALTGCGSGESTGSSPDAGPAADGGVAPEAAPPAPVPQQHRPTNAACTAPRPAGDPALPSPSGSTCSSDGDCTQGTNGRCYPLVGGPPPPKNGCSYDACTSDSDCGAGQVCDCRNGASNDANVCFHGNCRVDADCGGEYCSPSLTVLSSSCINVPAGSVGYFCHTRQDTCLNDSDCASTGGYCAFSTDSLHWQCYAPMCLGGVGP
jgi:hypothetical protein